MASLYSINVQWKATELPCKDDLVPLPLYCTKNSKIWQQWPAMRRQIFTLYLVFILSYFYLIQTLQESKEASSPDLNIKNWDFFFFSSEASKTSKALSSYSKFFKANMPREGKSNLLLSSDRPGDSSKVNFVTAGIWTQYFVVIVALLTFLLCVY